MRHQFSSLSDSKYTLQAITMINSLQVVNNGFELHYLCLDDSIYDDLNRLQYENVKLYHIENIYTDKLDKFRKERGEMEYCWALASFFTYWLRSVKKIGDIMYIDADLYFFNDFQDIYDEIDSKSVGIITHRFINNRERKVGKYNVGIIYFKDDNTGSECLKWWCETVLNPNNEFASTHGTCGDQKYLELFEPIFGAENVHVIDGIGHLALWNIHNHGFGEDINYIYWKKVKQKLIFCHFSHFSCDLQANSYKTNHKGEWTPESVPEGKIIYDYYFERIKETNELLKRWKQH